MENFFYFRILMLCIKYLAYRILVPRLLERTWTSVELERYSAQTAAYDFCMGLTTAQRDCAACNKAV